MAAEAKQEVLDAIKSKDKKGGKKGAPDISGFRRVWADEFRGPAGSSADHEKWDIIEQWPNYNNEVQAYTKSTENQHLSGDGELLIIPRKGNAWVQNTQTFWSSARLEGKQSFKCEAGEKMIFQAEIKVGNHPAGEQLGIWPAFWALGQSLREGTPWPVCGEWDILEMVNAWGKNQGTVHFSYDGATDAGTNWQKFSGSIPLHGDGFHTYSVHVNRKPNPYTAETLTWYLNGKKYFQLTGADVGPEAQWAQLAHDAFFPLLNVAVGGDFPNGVAGFYTPTDQTKDGIGSGLTVRYVAVYKSN